jgi:hypothetical protein
VSVVGETMSAGELMEWGAYEQTFGSLLVHERIDAGFAQVSLILANAFSKRKFRFRDFMPQWFRDLTQEQELERGIGILKALGREARADDLDAD